MIKKSTRFVCLSELTRPAGPSGLFASRWVNERCEKKRKIMIIIIIKSKAYDNGKNDANQWIISLKKCEWLLIVIKKHEKWLSNKFKTIQTQNQTKK